MRLSIGTAQFGFNYGITNFRGQVSPPIVDEILKKAVSWGVDALDTASGYGVSEEVLGRFDLSPFSVTTKFNISALKADNLERKLDRLLLRSLDRLNVSRLSDWLVHDPLPKLQDREFLRSFIKAVEKIRGVHPNIRFGVSVYTVEEALILHDLYSFDTVQIPFVPIDSDRDRISLLKPRYQEIQIRSVFLQGLLLASNRTRAKKFARWSDLLDAWQNWCQDKSMSPVEAALRQVKGFSEIDTVVVGVTQSSELREIVSAFRLSPISIDERLLTNDSLLLQPRYWHQLV